MIEKAINKILSLQKPPTFKDCEGVERSTVTGEPLIAPREPSIPATTLDSAIEIANTLDPELTIIECSFCGVWVRERGEFNEHSVARLVCESKPILPDRFPFGDTMSVESFKIATADFFVRDKADMAAMIETVSHITEVNEQVVTDDGMSTAVALKNKIGRPENGKVQAIWNLMSYRTFREIEQPVSMYLLRIHSNSRGGPLVSLHEASGYEWKIAATEAVYHYIRSRVGEECLVVR